MVRQVTYPGPTAPGPVPVQIDLPDTWVAQAAPGVALVAADPEERNGLHLTVVVSVRRVDRSLSLDDMSSMVSDEIAELPGARLRSSDTLDILGATCAVRTFDFTRDDEKFSQTQAMWLVPMTDHTSDAVTVTVTHHTDPGEVESTSVRDLIESVRVG